MDRLGFDRHPSGIRLLIAFIAATLTVVAFASPARAERLNDRQAMKAATRLVDHDYFSKTNTERGSTSQWVSDRKMVVFLEWGDGHRYCAQEFKVRLVDGKAKANAGEPFCSEVEWPVGESAAASSGSLPRKTAGRGSGLSLQEARLATVEWMYESRGFFFPVSEPDPHCVRIDPSSFRCGLRVTIETNARLKECRIRTRVTKDGSVETKLLFHACRKSDRPFLSFRRAVKAAKRHIDKSYFEAVGGSSGSMSRSNLTTFRIEYLWSTVNQVCLQPFKLKLIEGKINTNTGDLACADPAPWP